MGRNSPIILAEQDEIITLLSKAIKIAGKQIILCHQLDISPRTIYRWKHGFQAPSFDNYNKLITYLRNNEK